MSADCLVSSTMHSNSLDLSRSQTREFPNGEGTSNEYVVHGIDFDLAKEYVEAETRNTVAIVEEHKVSDVV